MNRRFIRSIALALPLAAVCACGGSRVLGDAGVAPADGGAADAGNPACAGKECGDDGYGGSCGTCINDCTGDPDPTFCHDGICANVCCPYCGDRECGDDGCAGLCGVCVVGQYCTPEGRCEVCTPDCAGKACGDDAGCGLTCKGTCPDPDDECVGGPGWFCMPLGCQGRCDGKQCGDDDGCGGLCVAPCPDGCPCSAATYVCEAGSGCCGKSCGDDDGAGGRCVVWCTDPSQTCNPQTFVCE